VAAILLPVAAYSAARKAGFGPKLKTKALTGTAGWFSIAFITIFGLSVAFQNYVMFEQEGD
jgi:hypothetical protein